MVQREDEILILPNTEFTVQLALSCAEARRLNAGYATIPGNVDLVILEALPPRTQQPAMRACHRCACSSFVQDPASLVMFAQVRALKAGLHLQAIFLPCTRNRKMS